MNNFQLIKDGERTQVCNNNGRPYGFVDNTRFGTFTAYSYKNGSAGYPFANHADAVKFVLDSETKLLTNTPSGVKG